ncbi:MAG: hypothetical protein HY894_03690 [Deltaproteobacteria bacterium]|nr:hypothetical protein [Deltaproteobacteria bacterium]
MTKTALSVRTFQKTCIGLCFALVAIIAVSCGGQKTTVSNDPSAPLYRAQGVDFGSYETAVIQMNDVSTNNNKGVDEVKAAANQSLETWLRQSGIFKGVKNDAVDASGLDVDRQGQGLGQLGQPRRSRHSRHGRRKGDDSHHLQRL